MPLVGLAVFVVVVAALAWWLARGDEFWTRVAAAGFLLVPLSLVVQAAAGNVTAVFGTPPPFVVLTVVAAVVLLATKRFHVPALVFAVLLTLVYLVLGLFGLGHPDSFGDFAPSVLGIAGAMLAIVGTSKALGARRLGAPPAASPNRRTNVWTAAGVLSAIAVTSAVQTVAQPAARAPAGAQLVTMKGDEFSPNVLRAKAGERMTVFVRNEDAYAHTFTIDEADVDVYVGPGRGRSVAFVVPQPASGEGGGRSVEFWCTVTGHDDMRGRLELRS